MKTSRMRQHNILSTLFTIALVACLTACTEVSPYGEALIEKYFLKVDNSTVVLEGTDYATVRVSAPDDVEWYVTDAPWWLNISPINGRGPSTLTISAAEDNPSTTARSETVRIKEDDYGLSSSFTVSQEGTRLSLSNEIIDATLSGGNTTVQVDANAAWTVSSAPTWVTCSPRSGTAGYSSVSITVSNNSGGAARSGNIIFKTNNSAVTAQIKVEQDGARLSLSKQSVELPADGGSATVEVDANDSWYSYAYNYSWLSYSPSYGNSGKTTVTMTATANTTTSSRSTTLVFSTGNVSAELSLSQPAAPYLTLDKSSLTFGKTGSTASVSVTSNSSWTASSNATWCTVSPTSGSNNGTIKVTTTTNNSGANRSATITVKWGTKTSTITVSQSYGETSIDRDDFSGDKKI